jgi:hypothetical protein
MKPYIGVTGIENLYQARKTPQVYPKDVSHLLMVGIINSYKTLIGQKEKDKPELLMLDEVNEIYKDLQNQDSRNVLLALHYFTKALYEIKPQIREKAKDVVTQPLSRQIEMLIEKLYEDYEKNQPPFSFGLQLNISWPDPDDVKRIKDTHPKLLIILQVSDFSSLGKVKRYYGFCDYILIDASKGRGIEFNLDEVVNAYRTIQECIPTTIGIAGGFSPENVRGRVLDLRKSLGTDNFCIDAQNRLRTDGHLDMHKVDKYLKEAIEAFQTKI